MKVTIQKDKLRFNIDRVIVFCEGEVSKAENKSITARDKRDIAEYLKLAKYHKDF